MKCEYCAAEDHLITACPTKKNHRALHLTLGYLLILLLGSFFVAGSFIGICAGAFMQGYRYCLNVWKTTIDGIKGPRDEQPEI